MTLAMVGAAWLAASWGEAGPAIQESRAGVELQSCLMSALQEGQGLEILNKRQGGQTKRGRCKVTSLV